MISVWAIFFIFETEPSRTTELVDVIVFHDYFPTRKRMRDALEYAKRWAKKYGKPVLDNEMCCLARANPYDMSIEMHDEYQIGVVFVRTDDRQGYVVACARSSLSGWNRPGSFYCSSSNRRFFSATEAKLPSVPM